jgi:hypothetical protein
MYLLWLMRFHMRSYVPHDPSLYKASSLLYMNQEPVQADLGYRSLYFRV